VEFADSPAQAAEFAAEAIAQLKRRAIKPTPNNFMVWYVYASGQMPDLNKAIDVLDSNHQDFSEARNVEVFERFFSTADEEAAVADVTGKLTDQVNTVLGNISSAQGDADAYADALAEAASSLEGLDGNEAAKSTIADMVESTHEMVKKNHALEAQLQSSTAEIERLREDMESLRQEAYTDGLTGIGNRKKFDQSLRLGAIAAMESGEPLCLLMIDIDHFKKFNDMYGHQVGDKVLRLLAETLKENIKGQDTTARYGGEEFSIVLPRTGLKDAVVLADNIRKAISSKSVRDRRTGEDLGKITISIGVSLFAFGEPIGVFIKRADQALYHAKESGRDQVCSENDLAVTTLSFSA
tara:strand:+ start:5921 stop:6979 length:1059 start_codon:yes stop_codon:yes gene_type:complete